MIKKILKMGDPLLLQRSQVVDKSEFGTDSLKELIQDLQDTQKHYNGIGIAAPQIGVSKQILLIEYYKEDVIRYNVENDMQLKVIINPEIEIIGEVTSVLNEGCLSVPGLRGEVVRPKKIRYKYFDQFGKEYSGEDDGLFARVLQHEYDHLIGILYPMRMVDISNLSFVDLD